MCKLLTCGFYLCMYEITDAWLWFPGGWGILGSFSLMCSFVCWCFLAWSETPGEPWLGTLCYSWSSRNLPRFQPAEKSLFVCPSECVCWAFWLSSSAGALWVWSWLSPLWVLPWQHGWAPRLCSDIILLLAAWANRFQGSCYCSLMCCCLCVCVCVNVRVCMHACVCSLLQSASDFCVSPDTYVTRVTKENVVINQGIYHRKSTGWIGEEPVV